MQVIYKKEDGNDKENIEVLNFYKDIAKRLINEKCTNNVTRIKIITNDGEVSYAIRQRSGTQFICEEYNNLPDDYIDHNTSDKFLTCINPEKNAYKFYKLVVVGNEVKASYGRMGVKKGEQFGERSFMYPASMFWIKYYEKIGKGYEDRTELYLDDKNMNESQNKQKVSKKIAKSTPSSELFEKLYAFAKNAVKRAEIKAPITDAIIIESKNLLDEMRKTSSVDEFNSYLLKLMSILQRPVKTGNGRGVKELMASSQSDFSSIILRENDLLMAMDGSATIKTADSSSFADYGIEVFVATDKQKEQVLSHLSDSLKPKVNKIYRVIPQKQQKLFNEYLKKNNIKKVKQLWHGSHNQNWLSIVKNSLVLNPDAIITGKMFGQGIYFAPSSTKSWNYTSYRGTSWASGSSDVAYMGLYAVAYGKPYDVTSWSASENYKQTMKKKGCDCLHAHAGISLRNDEIVLYHEAAIVLNYIVEFK